jgi:RimJ/RimL family protein N-acetyltransferase
MPSVRVTAIAGPRLVLRPLRPEEIDGEWREVLNASPMSVAQPPDEAGFRDRLGRSGLLENGWLDLAIDLDGTCIGRIQTFVPRDRPLPPGTFDVGIGLRERTRGKGYGREALRLLTDWLFEQADAELIEAGTDRANIAMRTVFEAVGWDFDGTLTEIGREWMMYRISRARWQEQQRQ